MYSSTYQGSAMAIKIRIAGRLKTIFSQSPGIVFASGHEIRLDAKRNNNSKKLGLQPEKPSPHKWRPYKSGVYGFACIHKDERDIG